jgi:superfamily I DNA/RNA helicase
VTCSAVARDLLAYLHAAVDPSRETALHRIYGRPPRGVGAKMWANLRAACQAQKLTVGAVIFHGLDDVFVPADAVQRVRAS